jgi:glucose/mannose-6-phosphate isomerase
MINLANLNAIKKHDKSNVYGSINVLPDQIAQAWEETQRINFPQDYKNCDNIVIAGMGGSLFNYYFAQALYAEYLKIPIVAANSYELPGFVGSKTLFFASSYSGTTEEAIKCAQEAKLKKARITGVTSGATLGNFLLSNNYPSYVFQPKYNPANHPRLGSGYMIVGVLGILANLGYISLSQNEVINTVRRLKINSRSLGNGTPESQNPAKILAQKINGKIPILIASEFLTGALHAFKNQINETSKNFSAYHFIPELNHHLMEGLVYPEENINDLIFIFMESDLYDKRNQYRHALTIDVVKKNNIGVIVHSLSGKTKFEQAIELLQLGSFVTFYLAMLHDVDPG